MKRFKVVTLGCRTNQYESQAYTDQLRQMGYVLALDKEEADLCIVNTCTVTESANQSSKARIRSLLRQNPKAKIVVTGCMAENASPFLRSLDERIEIVPNKQKDQLLAQVFPEEENLPEFCIQTFDAVDGVRGNLSQAEFECIKQGTQKIPISTEKPDRRSP